MIGFDQRGPLSGGIQTTGDYPGRARTPRELMDDIDEALRLIPGKHRLNLHASYAIFEDGEFADRDKIEPRHFRKWVEFAKERGLGLDFNPTFFSHPMVKENLTLSSPTRRCAGSGSITGKPVSDFPVFRPELGTPCAMNIWIPDGYKDVPADRLGPQSPLQDSLDQILSEDYDRSKVLVCLESKVFGIGLESYTVGSSEFTVNYAAETALSA